MKTFRQIFKLFCNTSVDKYAWVSAYKAECIFIANVPWSSDFIASKELRLLLECHCKITNLQNKYAPDVCIQSDAPGWNNTIDSNESDLITQKWNVLIIYHQISKEERKEIPFCVSCFSKFEILGSL